MTQMLRAILLLPLLVLAGCAGVSVNFHARIDLTANAAVAQPVMKAHRPVRVHYAQQPQRSPEEEVAVVKGAMGEALGPAPSDGSYAGQHIVPDGGSIPADCQQTAHEHREVDGIGWEFVRCRSGGTSSSTQQPPLTSFWGS